MLFPVEKAKTGTDVKKEISSRILSRMARLVIFVSLIVVVTLVVVFWYYGVRAHRLNTTQSISILERAISLQLSFFDFSAMDFTLESMNQALQFEAIEVYDRYNFLRATVGSYTQGTPADEIKLVKDEKDVIIGTMKFWGPPRLDFMRDTLPILAFGVISFLIVIMGVSYILKSMVFQYLIMPFKGLMQGISKAHNIKKSFPDYIMQYKETSEIADAFISYKEQWVQADKDRNEALDALRQLYESRRQQALALQTALEAAGIAISYTDEKGNLIRQLIGAIPPVPIMSVMRQNDFTVEKIKDILGKRGCNSVIELQALNEEEKSRAFLLRVDIADGVSWNIAHVILRGGGAALIASNESDLRQAERELLFKQKMEALGVLTSGVAHDFNNILAIVMSGIELRMVGVESDELLDLRRILSACERGKGLIRQLLNYSNRSAPILEVVNIKQMMQDFIPVLQPSLGPKYQLTVNSSAEGKIECDRNGLETGLLNLVINARDSMPDGGKITFSCDYFDMSNMGYLGLEDDYSYIVFSVLDEGGGVPEKIADKIFDPFFSTKDKGQGTGLGLSLVHNFAHNSRGSLFFENSEKGACFYLVLPLAHKRFEEKSSTQDTRRATLQDKRILIVDDETALATILSKFLKKIGMQVEIADGYEEVLDFYQSGGMVDIVLSDINLKGKDGYQVAELVRLYNKDANVILMSGNVNLSNTTQLHAKDNIDLILDKPFEFSTLMRVLSETLGKTKTIQKAI